MLPHFPKSNGQMTEIRNDKIWVGFYSVSPILSEIGMRPQREGRKSSFQDEQGNIKQIDYKLKTASNQRKLQEAYGMSPEDFIQATMELGAAMGLEVMKGLYETMEKVTKETGNIVDAKGGGVTQELFLELLEKIQFDFARDGKPLWPSLNLGSEAYKNFQRQWPEWLNDAAFLDRLKEIVDFKREEFREREADRRLVE